MVRRVDDIVRRVEALPGVVSAACASNMVPLQRRRIGRGRRAGRRRHRSRPRAARLVLTASTPHLLKTLNMPLVAGRDFTDAEGQGRSGVAIVNGAFAKRLWPTRTDVRRAALPAARGSTEPVDHRHRRRRRLPAVQRCATTSRRRTRSCHILRADAQHRPDRARRRRVRRPPITSAIRQEIRKTGSDAAAFQRADRRGGAAAARSGSSACSAGCSRSSGRSRWCSPRLASTACCPTRSRSGRRRSACAWRSAPAGRNVFAHDRRARRAAGEPSASSAASPALRRSRASCASLLYNVSATDPLSFVAHGGVSRSGVAVRGELRAGALRATSDRTR